MSDLHADSFEKRAADIVLALGPDISLDAFAISFDLIRLSTRLIQDFEQSVLRSRGWTMATFRVMFVVWVAEALEPREIARLSGLSRAAVSNVLNKLEHEGSITRNHESADRRLVTVRLTKAGEKQVAASYVQQNVRERYAFGGLTASETKSLLEIIRKLLRARLTR